MGEQGEVSIQEFQTRQNVPSCRPFRVIFWQFFNLEHFIQCEVKVFQCTHLVHQLNTFSTTIRIEAPFNFGNLSFNRQPSIVFGCKNFTTFLFRFRVKFETTHRNKPNCSQRTQRVFSKMFPAHHSERFRFQVFQRLVCKRSFYNIFILIHHQSVDSKIPALQIFFQ